MNASCATWWGRMKHCKKCGETKPLNHFYDKKDCSDGKHPYCKPCVRAYNRERHKLPEVKIRKTEYNCRRSLEPEYRAKQRSRGRKYYESIEGRANTLWKNARKSPHGKSREFTVTVEHIMAQLSTGKCAATGIPFQMDNVHQIITGRKKNPYAPSIDKINPLLGYTNENTRIVIWWYNMAKAELSDSEMKYFCKIVAEVV